MIVKLKKKKYKKPVDSVCDSQWLEKLNRVKKIILIHKAVILAVSPFVILMVFFIILGIGNFIGNAKDGGSVLGDDVMKDAQRVKIKSDEIFLSEKKDFLGEEDPEFKITNVLRDAAGKEEIYDNPETEKSGEIKEEKEEGGPTENSISEDGITGEAESAEYIANPEVPSDGFSGSETDPEEPVNYPGDQPRAENAEEAKTSETKDSSNADAVQPVEEEKEPIIDENEEQKPLTLIDRLMDASLLPIAEAKSQGGGLEIISINVRDPFNKKTGIVPDIKNEKDGAVISFSRRGANFIPGKYRLELELFDGRDILETHQDFNWGTVAFNTNKSIYAPGEKAKFNLSVTDGSGKIACDAKIKLTVKNEKLKVENELTTENGGIRANKEICSQHGYSADPDYQAEYELGNEGSYEIFIVAETEKDAYQLQYVIEVQDKVKFDVERITATRIYPPENYPVIINISANDDFKGIAREELPGNVKVELKNENASVENKGQDLKVIEWKIVAKKGDSIQLEYHIDFPNESPELFLAGHFSLVDENLGISILDRGIFKEKRAWQYLADQAPQGLPGSLMLSDIEGLYSIDEKKVVAKMRNGKDTSLKIIDLESGEEKNFEPGDTIDPDFPIGVKNGYFFWLAPDKRAVSFCSSDSAECKFLPVPEFDPALGEKARIEIPEIGMELVIGADNFYSFSLETGEIFSDGNNEILEKFRKKYDLDNSISRDGLENLGFPAEDD